MDARLLDTLAASVEPGSKARVVSQYEGGIRCAVHAVDLIAPSGSSLELVVKRFPAEYLEEDPDTIGREWHVLGLLARSRAPAPHPVWVDLSGEHAGTPTLVMTRLPGTVLMRVQAKRPPWDGSWVQPVVRALVQIQRTPLSERDARILPVVDVRSLEEDLRGMDEAERKRRMDVLPWAKDIWDALERHWGSAIGERRVLVHGDFHAGNILWHEGTISGVIDWSEARRGSAERDLAHLRWETILRYDLDVLDLVQQTYEQEAGSAGTTSAIWDLLLVWKLGDAIRSWVWFFEIEGRGAVTLEALEQRRLVFIERALSIVK